MRKMFDNESPVPKKWPVEDELNPEHFDWVSKKVK